MCFLTGHFATWKNNLDYDSHKIESRIGLSTLRLPYAH